MAPAVRRAHRPMSPRRPSERALVATDQKDDASLAVDARIVSYRAIMRVSARFYSEHNVSPHLPAHSWTRHPTRVGLER